MNKSSRYNFCFLFCSVAYVLQFCFYAMGDIRIGSLNLNGARDDGKRASFFKLCSLKKLDVILVQETHSTADNEADWRKEWTGETFLTHKTSNSCGVGILFSRNFIPQSVECEELIKGRLLKVRAVYENVKMVFINIYAPVVGAERVVFLDVLNEVIENCNSEEYVFIGGDFNCTEDSRLDRNHAEPHAASRTRLIHLMEAQELCDVWRGFHNKQRQYTWTRVKDNVLSYGQA